MGDYYDEDEELSEEELDNMSEVKVEPSEEGIQISVDPRTLNTIAEAAAHRLASSLSDKVKKAVEARLEEVLNDAWRDTIHKMACEAIEAFLTTPRAKTDEWGTPITGKTCSLAAEIPKEVTKWLNQKVNAKGNVDTYHSDNALTRTQWMLKTLVQDQLASETKKAADSVTEKAREVVRLHVGRFISEQMVPAISVDGARV